MMVLQNNVDIVAGAKLSCIYNLNNGKLYSVDSVGIEYLNALIKENCKRRCVTNIPDKIRKYFITENLIVDEVDLVEKMKFDAFYAKADFAWIEITQNCNLLCRHCYENASREEKKDEMALCDFKYVIDILQENGVKGIQLVGGEPLAHSKIKEFISYVAGKFTFIEIFTNGTLLNDSIMDFILQNNISLAFSVYSNKPNVHDYVTQTQGSYATTMKKIKKSIGMGINVRIASVEMKGIPKFDFYDKSVMHKSDLPRLAGRADLSLYDKDMLMRKLITKDSFKRPLKPYAYYRNKVIHNCFGDRLYIDINLNVYPCAMERRVMCGNLKLKSIKEIMRGELPYMTKDKIMGCKDCEYRYACFDCRPDSNNALIKAKPWYCTYNPFEGVWMDKEKFVDTLLRRLAISN